VRKIRDEEVEGKEKEEGKEEKEKEKEEGKWVRGGGVSSSFPKSQHWRAF